MRFGGAYRPGASPSLGGGQDARSLTRGAARTMGSDSVCERTGQLELRKACAQGSLILRIIEGTKGISEITDDASAEGVNELLSAARGPSLELIEAERSCPENSSLAEADRTRS